MQHGFPFGHRKTINGPMHLDRLSIQLLFFFKGSPWAKKRASPSLKNIFATCTAWVSYHIDGSASAPCPEKAKGREPQCLATFGNVTWENFTKVDL